MFALARCPLMIAQCICLAVLCSVLTHVLELDLICFLDIILLSLEDLELLLALVGQRSRLTAFRSRA